MVNQIRAVVQLFRPRALAQMAKSMTDLGAAVQELRRTSREMMAVSAHLTERTEHIERTVAALERSLRDVSLREAQISSVYRRDREQAAHLQRLPSVLNLETIEAHARGAIARAPLCLAPFPHLVVEDLWPDPFYEALIESIPPSPLFGDRPLNKQRLAVPFQWAPLYSIHVWGFLVDRVLDKVIRPAIVEKLRDPLNMWLRGHWPIPGTDPAATIGLHCTEGRILLRHRGYDIPPHRDPRWGFITCLMYLVRPGDSEAWGTQLLSVTSDEEAPSVAAYWIRPELCQLEKEIPFRRNTMLVFLNSAGAHRAQIPKDAEPPDLERYVYQFRIGPTGSDIRKLMCLLTQERKSQWSGKVQDYL